MPTIEEKIDASKAVEAELLAELLTLPGAEVINAKGENVLHALHRQRETSWQLGAWLPVPAFGINVQLSGSPAAQQAQAPVAPAENAVLSGALPPDAFQKLANTSIVDTPIGDAPAEQEPPTLVATEPPAPEAPAAEQG